MSNSKASETSIYTNAEKYQQAVAEIERLYRNATHNKAYNEQLIREAKAAAANKYLRR